MALKAKCGCGVTYKVSDAKAGRKLRCQKCGKVFVVPDDGSDKIAAASPPDQEADPFAELSDFDATDAPVPPRLPPKRTRSSGNPPNESRPVGSPSLYGSTLEERMAERAAESEPGDRHGRGFKSLFFGLFALAMAAGVYWLLARLEENGGMLRTHFLIAILYKLGGKWLPTAIIGLAGLVSCVIGLLNLFGVSVVVEEDD
jgi:hypothetical protein